MPREELEEFPEDRDTSEEIERDIEEEEAQAPEDDPDDIEPEHEKEEKKDGQQSVKIEVGLAPEAKNAFRSKRGRKSREESGTAKIASDEEVEQFVEEFAPSDMNKRFIRLVRIEPKTFRGKGCAGFIDRFDRSITLEEIKDTFGGGTYEIRMYGPKIDKEGIQKGNRYLSARRFVITGDPLVISNPQQSDAPQSEIVGQTLKSHEKLAERESERADRANEKFEKLLLDTVSGGGGSKEMLVMMQSFMQQMQEQSRHQMELMAQNLKAIQDKSERDAERVREEMRQSRIEAESRAKNEMNPLLTYMMKQSEENMKRTELMMKQSMDMAKIQIESTQNAGKTQLEIMQQGSKTQVDVLMQELTRISGELKDARAATNKDAMSELKKLVQLKELLKDISGAGGEEAKEPSLTDRIMDNLPQIQEAIGGFVQLFQKPNPAGQVANQQLQRPMLGSPPPPPPPPSPHVTQANPISHPVVHQAQSKEMKEVEIAMLVQKIKDGAEKYMNENKTAKQFIDDEVIGKFDDKILSQIAVLPANIVIDQIERSFVDADPDSPLFTKRGRDFMKEAHAHLKSLVAA